MVNLVIALILDNLYKNSDTFIPNVKPQCANGMCEGECVCV